MNQFLLKDHLEKLYPFKIISDVGSLTAATEVLGMSQSGLSHTIKTLEEILGTPLLVRLPRGITLTAEGETLYEFSKKIFHQANQVELQIKNLGKDEFGILNIATHEALATHVWPSFLQKMVDLFPKLDITLTSGRIDPIVQSILNGTADLALTVEPLNNPKLHRIPVYSGEFGFYTTISDKRKSISVDELNNVPILTDTHAHIKQGMSIPQYLALSGLKLKRSFTLNSFEAAISLAASGVGICVIPKKNSKQALSKKNIKEIKVRGLKTKHFGEHTIYASFLKDSQNKMLRPFVEELIKHVESSIS